MITSQRNLDEKFLYCSLKFLYNEISTLLRTESYYIWKEKTKQPKTKLVFLHHTEHNILYLCLYFSILES